MHKTELLNVLSFSFGHFNNQKYVLPFTAKLTSCNSKIIIQMSHFIQEPVTFVPLNFTAIVIIPRNVPLILRFISKTNQLSFWKNRFPFSSPSYLFCVDSASFNQRPNAFSITLISHDLIFQNSFIPILFNNKLVNKSRAIVPPKNGLVQGKNGL